MNADSCCILNAGGGAWAFASLGQQLSDALWIDVSEIPRQYNYLLVVDDFDPAACGDLFIPYHAMQQAGDKRLLATTFAASAVPTPETRLVDSLKEAKSLQASDPSREWCLKFPLGCGASGHKLLTEDVRLTNDWPFPLVVQEFIRLDQPEVYRMYGAGGQLFGWVVRRFPAGVEASPWVAHARGARYELAGVAPAEAIEAARLALCSIRLLDSFGCVDLLCRPSGEWVVLEVGTDGMFNHVDRDLGLPELEREIHQRIAEAFWRRVGSPPWEPGKWRPRSQTPA